jgi:hypothetical protein
MVKIHFNIPLCYVALEDAQQVSGYLNQLAEVRISGYTYGQTSLLN